MTTQATTAAVGPMALRPLPEIPLVSVIMANYNYARYLPDAVWSVIEQTYSHWELVICDDGSTDDSAEVLRAIAARDERITVLVQENRGQAAALNHAFQHARGEIIVLLDPDDWFFEHKLGAMVGAFTEHPMAGYVHHFYQPVSDAGVPAGSPRPDRLETGWLYASAIERGGLCFTVKTSEIALRSEVARYVFPLPEQLRTGGGDTYIGMMAPFLTEVASVPEVLSCYRQHGVNASGSIAFLDESRFSFGVSSVLRLFPSFHRAIAIILGHQVAAKLTLKDMGWLWESMAVLYVLGHKPAQGVFGFPPEQILANLADTPHERVWRMLFRLPPAGALATLYAIACGRRGARWISSTVNELTRATSSDHTSVTTARRTTPVTAKSAAAGLAGYHFAVSDGESDSERA